MRTAFEMLDRMEALTRRLAAKDIPRDVAEKLASEIVAELPAVDPDLAVARKLFGDAFPGEKHMHGDAGPGRSKAIARGDGDDYWEMRVVLAALKFDR